MYEVICDVARVLAFCEIIILLGFMIFREKNADEASRWTTKGEGMFRFMVLLLLFILFTTAEKLVIDAEPAVFPMILPFVYAFGIYFASKKGGMIKNDQ